MREIFEVNGAQKLGKLKTYFLKPDLGRNEIFLPRLSLDEWWSPE